jgi:1,2-diacylglycerol 3-alpha-glucosyltransferase
MAWIFTGITVLFLVYALHIYTRELRVSTMLDKGPDLKGPKVGIVSDWNHKGVPYQSKFLVSSICRKHDVHVFAYSEYIPDEVDHGYRKIVYSKNIKPWQVIRWIKNEDLKLVFFPDRLEDAKVLNWCKRNNVATVMIINYETIKKEEFPQLKKYTALMCPVKCTFDLLTAYGFKNVRLIRWGIDDSIYKPAHLKKNTPIKFIHNAGWGGAEWRKNTWAVVEAFNTASRSNPEVKLILKTQKPLTEYPDAVQYVIKKNKNIVVNEKNISMNALIKLYKQAQVSVLPSKWEGIGIPFLESLALGLPVITVNAPPMNEWIRQGYNGFCAKVDSWQERRDKQLLVRGALVDVNDLSKYMIMLASPKLIKKLSANAVKSVKGSKKKFTASTLKLIKDLCTK